MLGVAFGVGFVLGPALGGLAGNVDPRLPFWIAAALSLANGLYGVFILPESLPADRRSPFAWRRANPVGALVLLRSHPELTGPSLAGFLGNLAHASLPSIAVLYMMYRYGFDERTVGLTMAGVGLSAMIVQGGLIGPTIARFGERTAMIMGILFGIGAFTLWGFAPNALFFWLCFSVLSLWVLANAAWIGWIRLF